MSKTKIALMVGVAASWLTAGDVLAQGVPFAPTTLKVNGPTLDDLARTEIRDGVKRLRKTDEEFTNEQAGVKLFPGTKNALYVEMRTSALGTPPTLPIHRMQGACVPLQLVQKADGSVAAEKLPGEKWVTDNRGNEYRNANLPYLVPLGPDAMLYTFNYQPQGTNDTIRYAKVLDTQCNQIPVKNGQGQTVKQVVIMQKNNDDCSMNEDGGGWDTRTLPDGKTRLVMWAGCNGNGRDDGWLNTVDIALSKDAAGKTIGATIAKKFDVSLAQREERSRGRCTMSAADPDTAICTWTEGNNQPQRDGTWMAAVDVGVDGEQGAEAQSRILWKKMIEGRKQLPNNGGQTYSVRAKSARIQTLDATGNLVNSDELIVYVSDLRGNNNNNRKGGRYIDLRMGVAKATKAGLTWTVPITSMRDTLLGIDGTHLKMTGVMIQDQGNIIPGVTFLQGSQNGGGGSSPDIKILGLDATAKKFVDFGTYAAGGSYDRHLYSNYLGNNPGNQGRNFAGATFVKNPFEGQLGNQAKFLVLHALTGKDPADVMKPELKPASYVTVAPLMARGPAPAPMPAANGSGGGQNAGPDPAASTGTDPAPADPVTTPDPAPAPATQAGGFGGGCSMASSSSATGGIFFLLVGLGFMLIRRRRA
jgi:MYXO-CTERM domain-containing protein